MPLIEEALGELRPARGRRCSDADARPPRELTPAFSFGLMWDWAGVAGDERMRSLLADAARRFYREDRRCPLNYEPSGEDFLSPCLAAANEHRDAALPAVTGEHYEGGHWLGTFAVYLTSGAGLR